MKFMLSKKDIIALNQKFDQGHIINDASLSFATSYARKTTNWHKALAYVVRAILLDHVFEEGNKRTAALLIKSYAFYEGYQVHDDLLLRYIKKIVLNNVTSIRTLEEMIKDVIK